MSRENVEVLAKVLGALGARRFDATQEGVPEAIVARLDPDIEFEPDPRAPEAGVFRGRDAVLRFFKMMAAEMDRQIYEVEDLIDAGEDRVLVCLHVSGQGKSGAPFDFRAAWLATVRNRRVVRLRSYLDRAEAFEAVGLRE